MTDDTRFPEPPPWRVPWCRAEVWVIATASLAFLLSIGPIGGDVQPFLLATVASFAFLALLALYSLGTFGRPARWLVLTIGAVGVAAAASTVPGVGTVLGTLLLPGLVVLAPMYGITGMRDDWVALGGVLLIAASLGFWTLGVLARRAPRPATA